MAIRKQLKADPIVPACMMVFLPILDSKYEANKEATTC